MREQNDQLFHWYNGSPHSSGRELNRAAGLRRLEVSFKEVVGGIKSREILTSKDPKFKAIVSPKEDGTCVLLSNLPTRSQVADWTAHRRDPCREEAVGKKSADRSAGCDDVMIAVIKPCPSDRWIRCSWAASEKVVLQNLGPIRRGWTLFWDFSQEAMQ